MVVGDDDDDYKKEQKRTTTTTWSSGQNENRFAVKCPSSSGTCRFLRSRFLLRCCYHIIVVLFEEPYHLPKQSFYLLGILLRVRNAVRHVGGRPLNMEYYQAPPPRSQQQFFENAAWTSEGACLLNIVVADCCRRLTKLYQVGLALARVDGKTRLKLQCSYKNVCFFI